MFLIIQGFIVREMLKKCSLVGGCLTAWCVLFSIHVASSKQLNVVWSVNAGGDRHVDLNGVK